MSIILIEQPESLPVDDGSWTKLVDTLQTLVLSIEKRPPWNFQDNTVKQGVVISLGGSIYYVSEDESITGTPSNYVKISPDVDPSTASASYVANLTGVSWNSTYNCYTDVSGDGYLFDDTLAVLNGDIALANTKLSTINLNANFVTSNATITDVIDEKTNDNGVIIDGVLLKDNTVTLNGVTLKTVSWNASMTKEQVRVLLYAERSFTGSEEVKTCIGKWENEGISAIRFILSTGLVTLYDFLNNTIIDIFPGESDLIGINGEVLFIS